MRTFTERPKATRQNTSATSRMSRRGQLGYGQDVSPIAGCGDEYRTGSAQDQANGDTYCGRDAPGGPSSMTGQYQFQLKVIDTCNGNAEKASGSVITINW